jgi:hypothetical protein
VTSAARICSAGRPLVRHRSVRILPRFPQPVGGARPGL